MLRELPARPELVGAHVIIERYDPGTGLYGVRVVSGGPPEMLIVRQQNLMAATDAPPPTPPPAGDCDETLPASD